MSLQETSVCVTGLDLLTDSNQLIKIFAFAGEMTHSILVKNSTGKFTGTAYIIFREAVSAARAIKKAPEGLVVTVPVGAQVDEIRALRSDISDEPVISVDSLILALEKMSASDRVRISEVMLSINDQSDSASGGTVERSTYDHKSGVIRGSHFAIPDPDNLTLKPEPQTPLRAASDQYRLIAPATPVQHSGPILIQEQPKLSFFSGEKGKDTTFARWQYDINCLKASNYTDTSILQAIRKSLKTPAADIVRHLGETASVNDILIKLHRMYGTVLSGEVILQKFYSEPQLINESCAHWAARIEELCYLALEKKAIIASAIPDMLKSRFWNGLQNESIKNATRHVWKTLSFNDLLGEVREAEEEYSASATQLQQAQHQETKAMNKSTELNKVLKMMESIQARLDKLENRSVKTVARNTDSNKCTICGKEGHLYFGCRKDTDIKCNKCNEVGHIARGCRMVLNME